MELNMRTQMLGLGGGDRNTRGLHYLPTEREYETVKQSGRSDKGMFVVVTSLK